MRQHPSRFQRTLLTAVALSSTALAACVAEVPARPGVDYGYVAGTGGAYSTAPTPYTAAPYGYRYDDPYDDSYYGYGDPYYYGGGGGGGGGYYYGPSATFVYSNDHYYPGYYPGYSYRSRGNSYREDRRSDSGDHDWRRDGSRGSHDGGDHHNSGSHHSDSGDHDGRGGNWNHDRPGRPDSRPSNAPRQDDHPRPVMGGNRPSLGAALGRLNRAEPQPRETRREADKPASRQPSRKRD